MQASSLPPQKPAVKSYANRLIQKRRESCPVCFKKAIYSYKPEMDNDVGRNETAPNLSGVKLVAQSSVKRFVVVICSFDTAELFT